VLDVYREGLFDWQFLCGGDEHINADAATRTHLYHVTIADPSLCDLESLPLHYRACRGSAAARWVIEALVGQPEAIDHQYNPNCAHCKDLESRAPRNEGGFLPSEQTVLDNIARTGFHITQILPEPTHDGWSFSAGLYENYQHPEVIVFGQKPQWQASLINEVADRIKAGAVFESGKRYAGLIPPDYQVEFRAIEYPHWYHDLVGNTIWYYQSCGKADHPFPLLQLIWPDLEHRFPWDASYHSYVQPVVTNA
jgi:hypothetical protein